MYTSVTALHQRTYVEMGWYQLRMLITLFVLGAGRFGHDTTVGPPELWV